MKKSKHLSFLPRKCHESSGSQTRHRKQHTTPARAKRIIKDEGHHRMCFTCFNPPSCSQETIQDFLQPTENKQTKEAEL